MNPVAKLQSIQDAIGSARREIGRLQSMRGWKRNPRVRQTVEHYYDMLINLRHQQGVYEKLLEIDADPVEDQPSLF